MAWETRILVTTNSQSTANNTSNVTFTFQARRTDYSVHVYNNYGQAYWQIAAGGKSSGNNYFNINWNYGQNVWFTIASWSTTITHNSDGTYSSYAEAYVYTGVSPSSLSGSVNYTLTTIPRASTISSITGDTIGSNITVNISRQSSSFVHQVWWRINGAGSWTSLGTNFGTSCTFTLPMSVCNSVTQSTTCTLNIAIRAISNGSYVGGEVWSSKTVNVPSSVRPSFSSLSVSDSSRAKNLGIWVRGISTAACSINGASGSYGSWITSYRISTSAGHNIYSSSGTTGTINSSGNVTVTGTVTDSRGRTASKSVTISVQAYSTPRFNSYKIIRDSSKPTNVAVKASGSVSSLLNGSTQKNTLSYVIKYKQSSASSWTSVTAASGGTSFNTSRTLTNISSTRSYNFQLVLTDYFNSVTIPLSLSTSPTLADFKQAGVGIGKYHERGVLDVGGEAYISGNLNVEGSLAVDGRLAVQGGTWVRSFKGTAGTTGYIRIATLRVTTDYANSVVSFDITQRGYTNITRLFIRFANSDSSDPGLDAFQYLGSGSTRAYIVKATTSTWDLYIGKSESYDNIGIVNYTQNFGYNAITITWQGNQVSSVPSGFRQATNYLSDNASIIVPSMADRVTGYYVSGIWRCRTWASGFKECWCTWTGTINLGENNYSGFYYNNSIQVNYPWKFSAPKLFVDRGPSQFIAGVRAFGDTETYARFVCYGNGSYSQSNVSIYLYAAGV